MLKSSLYPFFLVTLLAQVIIAQPEGYRIEKGAANIAFDIHLPEKPQAAAVSHDAATMAFGVDSWLLLVNFSDGTLEKSYEIGNGDIRGITFIAGQEVIGVSGVGGVSLIDISSGQENMHIRGHPNPRRPQKTRTYDAVYSSEGRQLITISQDESVIRCWSLNDASTGRTLDTGIKKPQRLAISTDQSLLAVSGQGGSGAAGTVAVYQLPDLTELWRNSSFGVNPVIAFSRDGKQLAVGDDGGGADVIVFDAAVGSEVASRYVGSRRVGGLGWAADGIITAPSGMGFGIYLYPLKTEKETPQTLDKKFVATEEVDNAVLIGNNGSFAAVIGKKGIVRVFRLAQ